MPFEQKKWTVEELGADAEKMNGIAVKDLTMAACGSEREECDRLVGNIIESSRATPNQHHGIYG